MPIPASIAMSHGEVKIIECASAEENGGPGCPFCGPHGEECGEPAGAYGLEGYGGYVEACEAHAAVMLIEAVEFGEMVPE